MALRLGRAARLFDTRGVPVIRWRASFTIRSTRPTARPITVPTAWPAAASVNVRAFRDLLALAIDPPARHLQSRLV